MDLASVGALVLAVAALVAWSFAGRISRTVTCRPGSRHCESVTARPRACERIGGLTDGLDAAEEIGRVSRIPALGEFRTIPRGTPAPES